MRTTTEISIDLTAQELLELPVLDALEIDDIAMLDPTPQAAATAANDDKARDLASNDGTLEIELSAEQMDELLGCAQQ